MPKALPPISIIVVTRDSQRTIKECLRLIRAQRYTNKVQVIIVDGGSTDKTLDIARNSGLNVKIIDGGYKDNQEARRAIGITHARYEICCFIDSDNFMLETDWLERMVEPLLVDDELVATQTLRYAAPKNSSVLNRYFGLIGGADPVAYYLGKNDRLSWAFKRWKLLGTVLEDSDTYIKVAFDPANYPSVGCNGVMFRKSTLLKSKWGEPDNYFHADVFVDVAKLGYNKFGIVKNQIFHITAGTPMSFLAKRRKYMRLHHQGFHSQRRQLVFDPRKPRDVLNLAKFVILAMTFVEPFYQSLRGYLKKRDSAWFLHPLITAGMALMYAEATVNRLVQKNR
jgi:glycosyltransferase involved in cell wall biosynthesis